MYLIRKKLYKCKDKKMNSDILQIYELNLQKNYNLLDSQIAKSQIYEEKYVQQIIDSMDNLLSITSKTTKDYIICLTLNDRKPKNSQNFSAKIKKAEQNLKDYQIKIKDIKAKHPKKEEDNIKEIIPKYNKNDIVQRIEYDSFNKMNHAIRAMTQIENMSGNILVNLNGQSNIMKNEVKKIGEINNDLGLSKSYLSQMIDRQNYDTKIIISFGLFLFMIIICILIYKIYNRFIL